MFTPTFDLNLSEASIVEIIDVFVDFKRKSNPAYKSLNLRGVIVRVQEAFKCTLMLKIISLNISELWGKILLTFRLNRINIYSIPARGTYSLSV